MEAGRKQQAADAPIKPAADCLLLSVCYLRSPH